MSCYKYDKKITKNKKEIAAKTHDFNVENTSSTVGENHGRQPKKLHYIGECLQLLWIILYSDKP
jgi:hypothetical protein